MLRVTKEIIADVVIRSTSKSVVAKQNDANSRFLNVQIQDSGKKIEIVSPAIVMLNVQRPDGSTGTFYGSVNDNGTVKVELTSWILEQAGTIPCEIAIYKGSENEQAKLTTMTFYVEVEAAVRSDEDIVDSDEYNVIVDLLNSTQEAYNRANDAANMATNAVALTDEVIKRADEVINDCETATSRAENAASGVVTIEQNSQTALKFWVGTQAEYDALTEKETGCFYIISDDSRYETLLTMIRGKQNQITSGTDEPSGGADGDVYIQIVD